MGLRFDVDPPPAVPHLATELHDPTAASTSSAAAFASAQLDIEDDDWPALKTVPWIPGLQGKQKYN